MNLTNKKPSKNTITALITAIMILTVSLTILASPIVNAQATPPPNIKTYAYVTATPNPVGVGQQVIIVMWLNWPPPTAAGTTGDRWQGMTIEITKPNGDITHFGPFVTDSVGSTYTTYTPTDLGEYKVNFNFPGQILQRAGYTGLNGSNSGYIGTISHQAQQAQHSQYNKKQYNSGHNLHSQLAIGHAQ